MATIQEQLENAVAIYNKCADRVNKFINGGDTETVESETGNKPTIAKIVKDTQDLIAETMIGINEKSQQVTINLSTVFQLKQETEDLRNQVNDVFKKFGDNIGSFQFFATENIPDGWLRCDGTEISKDVYPELVIYLNKGDETVLTANLPNGITSDGRGRFLRDIGLNGVPLTIQEDELRRHSHDIAVNWNDHNTWGGIDATSSSTSNTYSTQSFGGDETRPVSLMGVLCIKAYHGIINDGTIDLQGIPNDIQNIKLRLDNIESAVNEIGQQTVLWSNSSGQASGNYVLKESMRNFKFLIIESRLSNGQRMHDTIYPNLLWNNGHFYAGRITGSYTEFKCLNDTTFSRIGGSGSYNMKIIGVK